MEDDNVIEGNRLINKFMALNHDELGSYEIDWRILMPVVEKITDKVTGCIATISFGYGYSLCNFSQTNIPEKINQGTAIETAWLAVVDFIKFYNTQNNKD